MSRLRLPVPSTVLVVVLMSGCTRQSGVAPSAATRPAGTSNSSSATAAASGSAEAGLTLPPGFPVLPGAVSLPTQDGDSGLIALWSSEQLGSAAYDFYVAALPAAGYPIVGLYPGGAVALIRFAVPGGAIWQVVAHDGEPGTVAIEVRVDRP